jgi:hypothetical protein
LVGLRGYIYLTVQNSRKETTARKLTEKVALVTDASCAIGVAIAKRLARDGIDVAISDMMSVDKAKAVVHAVGGYGVHTAGFRPTWAMPRGWTDWSRRWWSVLDPPRS